MPDLGTDLLLVLKEANNHDLTLVCSGGGQLKVHQFILVARSDVFKNMMNVDMEEKRTEIVEINDFDLEVVTEFVNYLYSDKIREDFSDLPELLKIGHKYEVSSLVDECSKRLEKEVTVTNVFQLSSLAQTYDVSRLSDECVNFLAENWDNVEPDELDKAPGQLLRKATTAMRKSKRILTCCQIPPLAVDRKAQYPTNFSTTNRLGRFQAIRSHCPIETLLQVAESSQIYSTRLAGIGLFINEREVFPIEFSLYKIDPVGDGVCFEEETFSLKGSYHNMECLKPLKLMLPVPVLIEPNYKYRVQVTFGKDIVNKTSHFMYGKSVCSIPMEGGNLELIIHANSEIPVLFFEEEED